MPRICHRHLKPLATATLCIWVLAWMVGVAHACGAGGFFEPVGTHSAAAMADGHDDAQIPPGCEQHCAGDVPLVVKLNSVQDPMGTCALPGLSAACVAPAAALSCRLTIARAPEAPPGVSLNIRFLRLAL